MSSQPVRLVVMLVLCLIGCGEQEPQRVYDLPITEGMTKAQVKELAAPDSNESANVWLWGPDVKVSLPWQNQLGIAYYFVVFHEDNVVNSIFKCAESTPWEVLNVHFKDYTGKKSNEHLEVIDPYSFQKLPEQGK